MRTSVALAHVIAFTVLIPAAGISDEVRNTRFHACFEFGSLVDGGTVTPIWLEDGDFWYRNPEGQTLRVDPESGATVEYSPADEDGATEAGGLASPDGEYLALIIDFDLWILRADGTDSLRVTENGTAEQPWISWGVSWSPNGRYLAIERYDTRGTPSIPIVDWLDPDAPVERVPSTQSREPTPQGTMFVVDTHDLAIQKVSDDDVSDESSYINLGWVPQTNELLFVRFDRPMRSKILFAADPETGALRTLITEQRETFVDGLAATSLLEHYLNPVDDETFIWLSERDGFHHLYLHRYDGTLVRQLTRGAFPVVSVEAVDSDNGFVYFTAKPDPQDRTSQHICRVSLDGGEFEQLSSDSGRRRAHFAPDYSCFVENHSDLDRPPRALLRRADGSVVVELEQADISTLEEWDWTAPQRTMAKAADGESEVFCAIYLPPEFNPTLKYPVVELIYAGPQWMIVPRRFVAGEYGDTAAAFAQLGYVAVILDSPGTAGVGKDYQDAVYGRLGQIEIPDHVAALKDLASTRPWMDLDRVGIHGKSWGGYFVLRAMLQAPGFYKVGVASSAVADLATTLNTPVVPYLGLPSENPEGYAAADCLPIAGQLQGELLITIGTADQNTPFGQSMRILKAFTEADKDVEVLVFPGEHHWLQGKTFSRWQRALRDFFREHLPPEPQ
jgi:dipeptidyl aminopeptidase/acylaminoacyl peptidase